jgi:hypothetical protein
MKKLLLLLGLLCIPIFAHAISLQDPPYSFGCLPPFIGCTFAGRQPGDAARQLAGTVAFAVSAFILTVAFISTVYGGYRIIASRGTDGVEAGKKAIMYALLGYFLATLVIPIVRFVLDFIATVGG